MIAYAWKILMWFGICVAVALSELIVPLHVAAERKKLDMTTSEIAQTRRDIRALETEFETRANIAQLERWNGDTLRLVAPVAAQFVRDEATLASIDFHAPPATGATGDVQMAAAIVPSQGVLATMPVVASAPIVSAVVTRGAAMPHDTSIALRPEMKSAVRKVQAQAVAMLDRKLLSDSVLGDLASGASAEAGHLH